MIFKFVKDHKRRQRLGERIFVLRHRLTDRSGSSGGTNQLHSSTTRIRANEACFDKLLKL